MSLIIKKIELDVHLGCSQEERSVPQKVSIDIRLDLPSQFKARESDLLEDTICYDQIVQFLKEAIQNREFKLVEYLGFQLYQHLRKSFSEEISLELSVTKLNPPVPEIRGGVTFICGNIESVKPER